MVWVCISAIIRIASSPYPYWTVWYDIIGQTQAKTFNRRLSNMSFSQVLQTYDLLDSAHVNGDRVAEWLEQNGATNVKVQRIEGAKGHTDFIRVTIPGSEGRSNGGSAPTLGVIGRLGGIGARPSRIGLVSDADG